MRKRLIAAVALTAIAGSAQPRRARRPEKARADPPTRYIRPVVTVVHTHHAELALPRWLVLQSTRPTPIGNVRLASEASYRF
jgi:hypothetical protein